MASLNSIYKPHEASFHANTCDDLMWTSEDLCFFHKPCTFQSWGKHDEFLRKYIRAQKSSSKSEILPR